MTGDVTVAFGVTDLVLFSDSSALTEGRAYIDSSAESNNVFPSTATNDQGCTAVVGSNDRKVSLQKLII
jgi:hypothetical protein